MTYLDCLVQDCWRSQSGQWLESGTQVPDRQIKKKEKTNFEGVAFSGEKL